MNIRPLAAFNSYITTIESRCLSINKLLSFNHHNFLVCVSLFFEQSGYPCCSVKRLKFDKHFYSSQWVVVLAYLFDLVTEKVGNKEILQFVTCQLSNFFSFKKSILSDMASISWEGFLSESARRLKGLLKQTVYWNIPSFDHQFEKESCGRVYLYSEGDCYGQILIEFFLVIHWN